MSVNPEDSSRLLPCDACDRADGNRMVAAEEDRDPPLLDSLTAGSTCCFTDLADRGQVAVRTLMRQGFTHRDRQVTRVMHYVAELFQACRQACMAQCTRAEIYATII